MNTNEQHNTRLGFTELNKNDVLKKHPKLEFLDNYMEGASVHFSSKIKGKGILNGDPDDRYQGTILFEGSQDIKLDFEVISDRFGKNFDFISMRRDEGSLEWGKSKLDPELTNSIEGAKSIIYKNLTSPLSTDAKHLNLSKNSIKSAIENANKTQGNTPPIDPPSTSFIERAGGRKPY